ncbi:MAG: ASKHA domain-containing protein [Candidatus Helarchaeota archaeon]
MTEYEIVFQPEGKRVKVIHNSTLLEAAKLADTDLTSICAGKGTCGKCKVRLPSNTKAIQLTESEQNLLTPEEIEQGIRLACQVNVDRNLTVYIPEGSRTGKQRLQIEGIKPPIELNPLIRKYHLQLTKPSIEDPKADFERVLDGLAKEYDLDTIDMFYEVLQNLGPVLRSANWDITITLWNNQKIIAIESGDTTDRIFGLSVDIGTTKLAVYLLNLLTGEVVAVDSAMNPQITYGEDIISRINYVCSHSTDQSSNELQRLLVAKINELIEITAQKCGVSSTEIYEMTAVGNTAMHHIFLQLNPKYLALAPYTPVIRRGTNIPATKLGIAINPAGNIHCPPIIAGYNGSDNVAVILATEIYKREELCLALDIGTNTEVVLGNKDKILVCSCASGPAFEGASIKYGMRAASGAIEKIEIDPTTLECQFKTIDDEPPRGICGSAIVDVIAETLKAGIIDLTGRMNKTLQSDRLQQRSNSLEYIIAKADETANGHEITITQKDIRQITLAKAAMHTGTVLLMEELGVNESDIDHLFIAGAFGNYINLENARFIGMYPEIELSKVEVVGNAAGTGARMVLLSKEMRDVAENIVKNQIEYIELAAKSTFQSTYLNSTYIPYADLSKYPQTTALLKKLGRYPQKLPHIF